MTKSLDGQLLMVWRDAISLRTVISYVKQMTDPQIDDDIVLYVWASRNHSLATRYSIVESGVPVMLALGASVFRASG